jgi:hypothetical protein
MVKTGEASIVDLNISLFTSPRTAAIGRPSSLVGVSQCLSQGRDECGVPEIKVDALSTSAYCPAIKENARRGLADGLWEGERATSRGGIPTRYVRCDASIPREL